MANAPVRRIYKTHMFGGLGSMWTDIRSAAETAAAKAGVPTSVAAATNAVTAPPAPAKSSMTPMLIIGGLAAAGLVAYFMLRKKS